MTIQTRCTYWDLLNYKWDKNLTLLNYLKHPFPCSCKCSGHKFLQRCHCWPRTVRQQVKQVPAVLLLAATSLGFTGQGTWVSFGIHPHTAFCRDLWHPGSLLGSCRQNIFLSFQALFFFLRLILYGFLFLICFCFFSRNHPYWHKPSFPVSQASSFLNLNCLCAEAKHVSSYLSVVSGSCLSKLERCCFCLVQVSSKFTGNQYWLQVASSRLLLGSSSVQLGTSTPTHVCILGIHNSHNLLTSSSYHISHQVLWPKSLKEN